MASSIAAEMDEVLKRYCECAQQMQPDRAAANERLKSGFFNLSRARYSMGARAVSETQYNLNMKALSLVSFDGESFTKLHRDSYNPDDELLASLDLDDDDDDDDGSSSADTDAMSLFKAAARPHVSQTPEPSQPIKISNPLNWFGIIVPDALREVQGDFVAGTQAVIVIVVDCSPGASCPCSSRCFDSSGDTGGRDEPPVPALRGASSSARCARCCVSERHRSSGLYIRARELARKPSLRLSKYTSVHPSTATAAVS